MRGDAREADPEDVETVATMDRRYVAEPAKQGGAGSIRFGGPRDHSGAVRVDFPLGLRGSNRLVGPSLGDVSVCARVAFRPGDRAPTRDTAVEAGGGETSFLPSTGCRDGIGQSECRLGPTEEIGYRRHCCLLVKSLSHVSIM